MPYLSYRQIVNSQFRTFSRYHRKRLFNMYRHPFYTRFRPNNVFLNTFLPESIPTSIRLSAGQLSDYARRKKKKKTYMAGFETSYLLSQNLLSHRITTLSLFLKGHGAQKRGVFVGLMRHKLLPTTILDVTPIAHNGTRAYRKRRL